MMQFNMWLEQNEAVFDQWFKNSKIKRGNVPLKVYHASHKKPNLTDQNKIFYFSERPRTAEFGQNVTAAYLKITNPFDFAPHDIEEILRLLSEADIKEVFCAAMGCRLQNADKTLQEEDYSTFSEWAKEVLGRRNIYQHPKIINAIKTAGFDGVLGFDEFGGEKEYIVFNPEQIWVI